MVREEQGGGRSEWYEISVDPHDDEHGSGRSEWDEISFDPHEHGPNNGGSVYVAASRSNVEPSPDPGLTSSKFVYREKDASFIMHDLVHDLAISVVGGEFLDRTHLKENSKGISRHCQYALVGVSSMPLQWTVAAPFTTTKRKEKKVTACIAQLIALRFHDCRSTRLKRAAFAPATSLRVLDLSECRISNLPVSIGELKKLRYLSAPNVRDRMSWDFKLSHLIYLNLKESAAISALPESIGDMKDLMHLNLSYCPNLWQLPESFMGLAKLVYLDFSYCIRLTLGESKSLGSLKQLEHLSLPNCMIEGDLAKALCGLTELRYLDLSDVFCSGNLCSGLQQVLVRFTKLRFLKMHGFLHKNEVARAETENLIEAISSLSSLEYLDLTWNKNLYNIHESIGNLSMLHTLDLSHCIKLERLPAALSRIGNLKSVRVQGCDGLDKSTLVLLKNVKMVMPYFVVRADDNDSESNIYLLEQENPTKLEISGLENVKSAAEAQRIKLVKKKNIRELGLVWTTPDAKRFVDDKDVLRQLKPPRTIEQLRLQSYNSAGFPSWMMGIATYLPCLVDITLEDMPNCRSLPPLGLLPSLRKLRIGRMDSIRKIGQDLYGGLEKTVFPRLDRFHVHEMKFLAEWNTSYSYHNASGKDGSNKELVFPELRCLVIADCPMLRFKSLSPLAEQTPPLPLGKNMTIIGSYQSPWEYSGKIEVVTGKFEVVTSSAAATWHYEAPHQWSLLRHLPSLKELCIKDCSDLTCSSTDLLGCVKTLSVTDCKSIDALPERLGDLTSLEEFQISNCEGIKTLPESIQQLTHLQHLKINGCPQLAQLQWPQSLQTLSVNNCKSIVQLPQRLEDLSSLKNLEISNCEGIKTLSESIKQLTFLQHLKINGCPQLAQLQWPQSLQTLSIDNCKSIVQLPQRLGDLSSLKNIEISNCEGIKALPESIQQLTCLQRLQIFCCPQLSRWCRSEENKKKLSHIKIRVY